MLNSHAEVKNTMRQYDFARLLPKILLLLGAVVCFDGLFLLSHAKAETHRDSVVSTASCDDLSLETSRRADIPFDYEPPERPLVTIQIRVNKSRALTFMVDSGSDMAFFLLPWAKKELNLQTTGEVVKVQPGKKTMEALESCDIELVAKNLPRMPNSMWKRHGSWMFPFWQIIPVPESQG